MQYHRVDRFHQGQKQHHKWLDWTTLDTVKHQAYPNRGRRRSILWFKPAMISFTSLEDSRWWLQNIDAKAQNTRCFVSREYFRDGGQFRTKLLHSLQNRDIGSNLVIHQPNRTELTHISFYIPHYKVRYRQEERKHRPNSKTTWLPLPMGIVISTVHAVENHIII